MSRVVGGGGRGPGERAMQEGSHPDRGDRRLGGTGIEERRLSHLSGASTDNDRKQTAGGNRAQSCPQGLGREFRTVKGHDGCIHWVGPLWLRPMRKVNGV